jgi:phosphate starvation-inducible protein PhoH and related proteins
MEKEHPLGISALTPPQAEDIVETLLEFPDNRLLIDLCGEFDRNLAQIEHQMGVHILRRGNRLAVIGDKGAREQAAAVLRGLYARLEAGRGLAAGDIDGAIRLGRPMPDTLRDSEQIEMFQGGRVELRTRKKPIEPRTEAQKAYVANLFANELGFGIGPAGTGKTYLAVAVGVTLFISGAVEKIILSRPAVEAGERLGFLPGDMREKIDPYMQPLYDALNDFLPQKQVQKLLEDKRIEIAPLAFMRGRTLSNAFVVLDEAQNATTMQMKMFLTRLGEGSRMVITGDRTQVDLPRGTPSGLQDAERILRGVKGVTFNYFTSKDVVRHPLVGRIIEAYEADEAQG